MYYGMIAALALVTLVGACDVAPLMDDKPAARAPARSASAQIKPTQESVAAVATSVEDLLKKGMAYADFRKTILARGWLPFYDPACKKNVGGVASICNELMELESCSSDGHCVMRFAHGPSRNTLRVSTYGDYTKWDTPAREAEMTVQSWDISTQDKQAFRASGAVACPAHEFDAFLKAFAQDKKIQKAFTRPLVKVAVLLDLGDEGYKNEETYISREDYEGFRLTHRSDGYHLVGDDGEVDPQPVKMEIKPETGGAFFVKVPYGTEGISYRFRSEDGCWYLAEDPEPSSP